MTLAIFKLNGQMLGAGEAIARPVGITVARWQVLGAVLREPLTVSGIGRQMGITRQAVQRIVNRLVDEGMLESSPNPAHKRSHCSRQRRRDVRRSRESHPSRPHSPAASSTPSGGKRSST